ncbi:hypothetical protein EMQ25_07090 [Arsenicitalea aurantiaca]|uniref:Uncharacterized protein n=1 Tax=Arsenicitalea aurantiaca TaxID=1783274 RepID=A0A433XFM8_9HYPH|nr:hypothetical protein [Arsenicitalea aurantiaca]RUT32893.1 hypothetical protein EMQ25_07090 [Arsenicitalea aurantiaca]
MNVLILILAALVWLVALVGFVQIVRGAVGIARLAPVGTGPVEVLWPLGRLDYPAIEARLGQAAAPHVARFRKGIRYFVMAIIPFFALIIMNIVTGQAA